MLFIDTILAIFWFSLTSNAPITSLKEAIQPTALLGHSGHHVPTTVCYVTKSLFLVGLLQVTRGLQIAGKSR